MKAQQLMAKYHKWAYQILFETMDKVEEASYFADKGMAFNNLHGTLNHLYMGDTIWYCRFKQQAHHFKSVADISFDDYDTGKHMILTQCDLWIEFIKQLPEDLPEMMTTINFRNETRVTPYLPTLMHVSNHATHHRGQISTVLTQMGFAAPEMDLLYYLLVTQS